MDGVGGVDTQCREGYFSSIRSQDIERKRSRNHGLPENSMLPYIVCGGIIRPKRPTAKIALLAW